MTDPADIQRLRAAGFRYYGVSGGQFILPSGDIISAEQALALLDRLESQEQESEVAHR